MNLNRSLLHCLPIWEEAVRQRYTTAGGSPGTDTHIMYDNHNVFVNFTESQKWSFSSHFSTFGKEWWIWRMAAGQARGGRAQAWKREGLLAGGFRSYFQTPRTKKKDKNHNNMRSGTQFGVRLLTAISIKTHNPVTQYHYCRADKLLSRW